jgi:predicted RNA-binding protein YlqC (UPF0109 family)
MADIPGLVKYIAAALVDESTALEVSEYEKGRQRVVKLQVGGEDMGRMIGREGRIANAIRSLIRASADDTQWGLDVGSDEESEAS